MQTSGLEEEHQSAYRQFHSTETASLKVQDDVARALGGGQDALVLYLDLSAAFDTVDNDRLLDILHEHIGVSETALDWFRSYMSGRSQRVCIGSAQSGEVSLANGFLQGSVLGPILFSIYTKPIQNVMHAVTSPILNLRMTPACSPTITRPSQATCKWGRVDSPALSVSCEHGCSRIFCS